jgi:alpha-glucosidase
MHRAPRFAALLLLAAILTACGSDPTPPPDAATDAGLPDAAPADGRADAGLPPDCPITGPLPAWATGDLPAGRLVAACPGVDLTITGLPDGVARLSYGAPGEALPARSWAVSPFPPAPATVQAGAAASGAVLCTADLVVVVTSACRVLVTDRDGAVLLDDGPDGGYQAGTTDGAPWAAVTRQTPAGERFYGFGERTGRLDRRGTRMVFRNTDAYDATHGGFAPDADPLYQSIPVFVGLRDGRAYGVFTDTTYRQEMDMAAAASDRYTITTDGGRVDQYVIAGPAMAEVVRRTTGLTGRMPLPPRWALGYHQSRWGYSPDTRLTELAQAFRSRRIPADGLWLDIQHLDGYRTFTWDPAAFPDPAGLTADLAAQGFKLTVIADPGIKRDPGWDVYDGGLAADVFLRGLDGEPFVGVVWPGDSVFPDFTAARARTWWAGHVEDLVERGVRGVWLDVNEPTTFPESGGGSSVPDETPVDGDGMATTMAEAHNVYAVLEAQATYDGLRAAAPDRRPFILCRAGYAGIQRWAAAWTGDAPSTFTTLGMTLPMLQNLGLSGEPFVGSDVGGYSGGATPELFARWMAVGALSPFFRGHVTSGVNDQEPWAFGQEVEDISRFHAAWRYRLLPYLYGLFADAAATGAPVLRPLVYAFQDDPAVETLDDQAMLGPWLLAAPVLAEGALTRSVYLPAGRWFEYHSGAIHDGPVTLDHAVTLAALPLYVREGALLPHGPDLQFTDQAPLDPLRLDAYPGPVATDHALYEDAGDGFAHEMGCFSRTRYTLQQTPTGARLAIAPREGACPPPARTLEVRIRRVDQAPTAATFGGEALILHASLAALEAAGTGFSWDAADRSVVVRVIDQDDTELTVTYDPEITEPRPWVDVPIVVHVPAGTPTGTPIHIASSVDGWAHHPLAWGAEPDTAEGVLSVPRGEWFWFKYTRGDWSTVEKWPACEEATNRYAFGAAHPGRDDTVWAWADGCPP